MEQRFKSIYFKDYPSHDSKAKSVTLAFNEPEARYFNRIKHLSNEEIRELIGSDSYEQLSLFSKNEERSLNQIIKIRLKSALDKIDNLTTNDVTFVSSKKIPFQRWYPYIEGYSPEFVKYAINNYCDSPKTLLDPFVGTGTTIFAADTLGISTYYSEINPLLQFIIQTKIKVLNLDFQARSILAKELENTRKNFRTNLKLYETDKYLTDNYIIVFGKSKYFPQNTLEKILRLSSFIYDIKLKKSGLLSDLLTIATLSSLLPCSYLKKAGDVRYKTEIELTQSPPEEFEERVDAELVKIVEDILNEGVNLKTSHYFILSNAKNFGRINSIKIDSIITSPPYLNGTNYFRNTKLELWFLKYLLTKSDLRQYRDDTLTCGINDVNKQLNDKYSNVINNSPILKNCLNELIYKSYDKRIPIMVQSYFSEMNHIFSSVQKHLVNDSKIVIDIGDSIFANVHIQTDEILSELLSSMGYLLIENKLLRKRRSRNKSILSQTLLVYKYKPRKNLFKSKSMYYPWDKDWQLFKKNIPHQKIPYSKRNWGHSNHSICSYQGKLKPSIAHHLVKIFVPESGTILDPFCGVGTIPFEAALTGKKSYGFDISKVAYYISKAKVGEVSIDECYFLISQLNNFISSKRVKKSELLETQEFGFNKKLQDYYHSDTLNEIILARRYFRENLPENPSQAVVFSSLLHILHGNRPYALSRRSHPIVPYAPSGEYKKKNLILHLKNKVDRILSAPNPLDFCPGKIFLQDSTAVWPQEIHNLDAIITSPPFFDSTRFYLANWIRIWFSGWSEKDFNYQINSFIEEKQKNSFNIYESIFRQSRERLKEGGVCVLHLGKSNKCDMAKELQKVSKRWFKTADLFDENVEHCESHGIRDKGTVTSHQYLVLT